MVLGKIEPGQQKDPLSNETLTGFENVSMALVPFWCLLSNIGYNYEWLLKIGH